MTWTGDIVSAYKVPSMKEIESVEPNGYNVVSTFSGAGGSCLGYRMAGYKVRWANEFIPAAQETYRANHKGTYLSTKDIREVSPKEILEQSGLSEVDVLDGSPPCAAFSTAGLKDKSWGKRKSYSDSEQVVDDLFFEYTRILDGLQPKTFIAENVSGLVKGTAKGYFKRILAEMKSCGYQVSARLLDSSMLGVPQRRQRLIFVGVRNDLCQKYGVRPCHPAPEGHIYTFRDAVEGVVNDEEEIKSLMEEMGSIRAGEIVRQFPKDPKKKVDGPYVLGVRKFFNLIRQSYYEPASTLCQSMGNKRGINGLVHPVEDRYLSIPELKRIMSVPDDFILTGTYGQKIERLGRMVPPVMMCKVAKTVQLEILDKI